jgi:aminoglycoside 3-N-acetyltransferase
VMYKGHFGDANVRVCDTEKMTDLLYHILKEDPEIFS